MFAFFISILMLLFFFRAMLKRLKAGKYQKNVTSKAAYEATRPDDGAAYATMDKTDEVFDTIVDEVSQE